MRFLFSSISHTPENAVGALVVQAMQSEFDAFIEQLEECPTELFGTSPLLGHSIAWHALHIMDWTRCMIQWDLKGVNPKLTYSYLGFEKETWAQAVYGPTLAQARQQRKNHFHFERSL